MAAKFSIVTLFLALAGQGLCVGGASAQDADQRGQCLCETALNSGGRFSEVAGDVSVLSNAGLTGAQPGLAVGVGSRIMSGPDGAGRVVFSRNCVLDLEKNTNYDLQADNKKLCVRASRNAFTPREAAVTGGGVSPAVIGAGALVLGGVGAGVAVAAKSKSQGNFPPLSF